MKYLILLALLSCAHHPHNALTSPFPSTVPELHIPNAHAVGTTSYVLRGQRPMSLTDANELKAARVQHILVFRNETPGESGYAEELSYLKAAGFADSQVTVVPFPWKDVKDPVLACQQLVEGLQVIRASADKRERVYFHCTVGEDRTGLLAAAYRLLTEKTEAADLFKNEMCKWGFGGSNPQKPTAVAEIVYKNIDPVFARFSFMAHASLIKWSHLDAQSCKLSPENEKAAQSFELELESKTGGLRCPKI